MATVKPRRGRVVVPSFVAGLLLAFSLPPWGWWPLAFVGAAVLFVRLHGLAGRARALAGWVAGMGCFVPGLWWAASFNWYGAVLLMAVEAVFVAVAAALVPTAGRWRVLTFTGAFTLLEAARMSWPFGGLPLAGVYLGQADGPLLPAARLGGPLLLTALVWLGGAAAGSLVLSARRVVSAPSVWSGADLGSPSRPALAGALAAAVVVAVGIGGALAPDGGAAVRTLSVSAVQGGGRRGTSHVEVEPATVFAAQVAATANLAPATGADPARLVVWPEDVIALGPRLTDTREAARMASIARRLRATVVAGVTETVSATAFRNEAVVWGPDGRIVGVYEKVHRVPFGEYVPYRGFFAHFANLSEVPLDAIPGHGTGELATPAGRIGLMLSYEVFFADRGRAAARAGAELLVVPTNTSSYATSQVPATEVAADRVQAVEEGRFLVQAAPTGYSTVVDPEGRVERRTVLGRRQVLTATVGLRAGATVYERLGDLPMVVLSAAALALGLASAAARRRHDDRSWRPSR
jgi:apolipoprotein N-acyltransferase